MCLRFVFNQLIRPKLLFKAEDFYVSSHVWWGSFFSKGLSKCKSFYSKYLSYWTSLSSRIFIQQLKAFIVRWKHKQTHKRNLLVFSGWITELEFIPLKQKSVVVLLDVNCLPIGTCKTWCIFRIFEMGNGSNLTLCVSGRHHNTGSERIQFWINGLCTLFRLLQNLPTSLTLMSVMLVWNIWFSVSSPAFAVKMEWTIWKTGSPIWQMGCASMHTSTTTRSLSVR